MGKLSLRYFGPVVWETMLPDRNNIKVKPGLQLCVPRPRSRRNKVQSFESLAEEKVHIQFSFIRKMYK